MVQSNFIVKPNLVLRLGWGLDNTGRVINIFVSQSIFFLKNWKNFSEFAIATSILKIWLIANISFFFSRRD